MYKSPVSPQKLWIERCAAAEVIRERFGLQKALQYLVGEKFLSFVWQSERHPSLAADLPAFVTEIRRIFSSWEITAYLDELRRTRFRKRKSLSGQEIRICRKPRAVLF